MDTIHESDEDIPPTANHILRFHGMLCHYAGRGIGGRLTMVRITSAKPTPTVSPLSGPACGAR